jgi:hypothetical protein
VCKIFISFKGYSLVYVTRREIPLGRLGLEGRIILKLMFSVPEDEDSRVFKKWVN